MSIKQIHGHYEAYSVEGKFICSADTLPELKATLWELGYYYE